MLRLLEELESKLYELNIKKSDVCLLGSASLAVSDFCINNDLEFVIKPEIWANLKNKDYYGYEFNSLSNILRISDKIECQKNSLVMFGLSDNNIFKDENSFEYEGYRIIKPYIYLAHKVLCNREKDRRIIEKYKSEVGWNVIIEKKVENMLAKAYSKGWSKPVQNLQETWNTLLKNNEEIYIFGTGSIGKHVYHRMKNSRGNNSFQGFLVSEKRNEKYLFDQKILSINEVKNKNCLVLIAVSIQNMVDIENLLKENGFNSLFQAYQFYIKEDKRVSN